VTETPNPNIVDTDTITGEMHPIRRAVISIGSNDGERRNNLQGAVDSLADTPEVWLTAVSPVYETDPVDAPEGSRDYLNAIVLLDTTLSARTLLERAHAVEAAYGRDRDAEEQRNAPRTLDVDLIVVGDRRADEDDLQLPHPRAHERAFVLVPWLDLEADAELLDAGPVAELVEKTGRDGVRLREDVVLEHHE
jgi:2-amino-4-hydroxy-6-hydroxymethyldihydropteridine diphosphokinase